MEPAGERRGRVTAAILAAMACAVVVGLVVLSSAGGSVRPITESTKSTGSATPRPPSSQGVPPPPRTEVPQNDVNERPDLPDWLSAIGRAMFWVLQALFALLVAWGIYAWVRKVRLPKAEPGAPAVPDAERPDAAVQLAEAVETSLLSVEGGTATDAVIACWVALEESAAAAGVARRASETSSEFTVRVLSTGISEAELVGLARLYREARYSTHGSTEAAREQARSALIRLRDELATAARR